MISVDKVSVRSHSFTVLQNITLQLTEKRIGIVGANGSGKSTLARLLNALRKPTEGTVTVEGLLTTKHPRKVRHLVGFVFQNPDHQIVYPLVEEDLAFGLKALKLSPEDTKERIRRILMRYGMESLRLRPSHHLSGGEKQLLALSGVEVMEPRYIVFDEPTTFLDLKNRHRVTKAMDELPQTLITVTHDLDLLAHYDRVIVLDQGQIVDDDEPAPALKRYIRRML